MDIRDKIRGSLIGGAAGDALGYTVEFKFLPDIRNTYVKDGIVSYEKDDQRRLFVNMLEYKLKENGGRLIKVDKYYASSQICHCCKNKNPEVKDLSIRTWDCPHCGKKNIDRDYNAALNIKKEGLRLLTAV